MTELDLPSTPGYLIRRLQGAYTDLWRARVGAELTGPQFSLLHEVAARPAVDQITLAQRVAIDRSTMADLARRLEERGLIQRRAGQPDGRRKIIEITLEGRDVLARATEAVKELSEVILDPLPPEQRPQFIAALRVVADRCESLADTKDAVSVM